MSGTQRSALDPREGVHSSVTSSSMTSSSVTRTMSQVISLASVLTICFGSFLAFAQEGTAAAGERAAAPAWMQFFPIVVMFVILYVFMIRPQAKKAQTHRDFLAKLKRGDQVITASGMLGRVEGLTEQFVTLEIADGVRVKMVKSQIGGPLTPMTSTSATEAKA